MQQRINIISTYICSLACCVMLPRNSRLCPHVLDGFLHTYGDNYAYKADPHTLAVVEKRKCDFPHTKWFNEYLTQPVLHDGHYYATFMDMIYRFDGMAVSRVGHLSRAVLRNCLVSNGDLCLLDSEAVEVVECSVPISVVVRNGIFLSANAYLYQITQKSLHLLTPTLDYFEQQHYGDLLCYGGGFCWFADKKRVRMVDLSDLEEWTLELDENAVLTGSLVRFSTFGPYVANTDLAALQRKQALAAYKQSHVQKLSHEIADLAKQNQHLLDRFKEVDELWAGIDAAYYRSTVRFEVRGQDIADLEADIADEIAAMTQRVDALKATIYEKISKERAAASK